MKGIFFISYYYKHLINYHSKNILSSEILCFRRESSKGGYILAGPQIYIIEI